jgi:simple sugar transport system permease protein
LQGEVPVTAQNEPTSLPTLTTATPSDIGPASVEISVPQAAPNAVENRWLALLRFLALRPETTPLAGLIITFITFSLLSPLFLTRLTAITVASSASELGIVSIGVTLLMISGNFDLSVGAISAFAGYAALLALRAGLPNGLAIVAALGSGLLVGALNGALVIVTKIHSFVVTLGMMLILYSILNIEVNGVTTNLGMSPRWENAISGPNLGGFQMSLAYFVVLTILGTIFLLRTRAGNWTYAMGQNREAARNLGVPLKSMTVSLFMVSGFCAALMGLEEAARFDSVDPANGVDLELYVIAVIVLGGASLFGGYGSAIGTFIGAIIYGIIENGIVLAGAPGFLFDALVGLGLFLAVMINEFILRKGAALGRRRPRPIEVPAQNGVVT